MQPATIISRIVSVLIDGFICLIPACLSIFLIVYGLTRVHESSSGIVFVIPGLAIQLALSFYFIHFYSTSGQTFGMRYSNIKITRVSDGAIPTLKQSLLRDLPYVLSIWAGVVSISITAVLLATEHSGFKSAMTAAKTNGAVVLFNGVASGAKLLFTLNILVILCNHSRRSIMDFWAKTWVVQLNPETPVSTPPPAPQP